MKSKAADKWRRAHLERGEGCDRHKKRTQTWMQPTQEGMEEVRRGVGSEDIRKEEWWNDQCGEGMRKLYEDLPATTTSVGSRIPVKRGAKQGGDGKVDGK